MFNGSRGGSGLSGTGLLALRPQSVDRAHRLGEGRLEGGSGLAQVRLHGAGQLGQQNLTGLEVSELVDLVRRDGLALEDTALDDENGVGLGEGTKALGRLDHVTVHEGERGRTGEQRVETLD